MRFILLAIFLSLPSLALADLLDLAAEFEERGEEVVELEESIEPAAPKPSASQTQRTTATSNRDDYLENYEEAEVEIVQQIELVEINNWCATGKNQSPINLDLSKAIGSQGLAEVEISYKDMALRLLHEDEDLVADYPLGSYLKLGDERYELLEYKFKIPSEHQINGFNYPLEIQLIHKNGAGNHLALAVMVAEGEADEYLQLLLNKLPKQLGKQEVYPSLKLNPARFLPTEKEFFYYSGSLTTGTCEEGTAWLVFQQPLEASVSQLMSLHKYLGENAREVQPLNGRLIVKSWLDKAKQNTRNQQPAASGYYFEY